MHGNPDFYGSALKEPTVDVGEVKTPGSSRCISSLFSSEVVKKVPQTGTVTKTDKKEPKNLVESQQMAAGGVLKPEDTQFYLPWNW